MSYSLFANDPHEQSLLALAEPFGTDQLAQSRTDPLNLPELSRLIKLRDALLILKGPLANGSGLRSLIERRLLGNEVLERVLGKRDSDNSTRVP